MLKIIYIKRLTRELYELSTSESQPKTFQHLTHQPLWNKVLYGKELVMIYSLKELFNLPVKEILKVEETKWKGGIGGGYQLLTKEVSKDESPTEIARVWDGDTAEECVESARYLRFLDFFSPIFSLLCV